MSAASDGERVVAAAEVAAAADGAEDAPTQVLAGVFGAAARAADDAIATDDADTDCGVLGLPRGYEVMPRMWKSIPIAARDAFLGPVRRHCIAFADAHGNGDRGAAAEALMAFMELPRRCLLKRRGGTGKQRAVVMELRRQIAAGAAAAAVDAREGGVAAARADGKKDSDGDDHGASANAAGDTSEDESPAGARKRPRVSQADAEMAEAMQRAEQTRRDAAANDARAAKRADAQLRDGSAHAIHYAVKGLVATSFGAAPLSDGVVEECKRLHPVCTPGEHKRVSDRAAGPSEMVMLGADVRKLICKVVANGSAPGPSGWTGEMLRTVALDDASLPGLTAMVLALCNEWFAGADCEEAVATHLLAARLVLIEKRAADGTRKGLRPIACGEVLVKAAAVAAKAVIGLDMANIWKQHGIQFGVATPGGCDAAVLKIQAALDADCDRIAVMADVTNAFNTRSRAAIARELYACERARPVYGLFRFAYGRSTPLIVYDRKGACAHVQASSTGVRQGDPLASFLFALSMDAIYARTRAAARSCDAPAGAPAAAGGGEIPEGGDVECVAFQDDLTIIGRPADATRAMDAFIRECKREGLQINLNKCAVLCPGGPGAARSASEAWCAQTGVPLEPERFTATLGSVVGRDEAGMQDWVVAQVRRHERFFAMTPRLSKQNALMVLRVAGVPRFNHICRSLPPRLTERGAEEFDAAVVAAFQLIGGFTDSELQEAAPQAQLPLRQGGCGLRSYKQTAAAAYLGAVALAAVHIPASLVRARLPPAVQQSIAAQRAERESSAALNAAASAAIASAAPGPVARAPAAGEHMDLKHSAEPTNAGAKRRAGSAEGDAPPAKRARTSSLAALPPPRANSRAEPPALLPVASATVVEDVRDATARVHALCTRDTSTESAQMEESVAGLVPEGAGFWAKYAPGVVDSSASATSHVSAPNPTHLRKPADLADERGAEDDDPAALQERLSRHITTCARRRLLTDLVLRGKTRDAARIANCALEGAWAWLTVLPVEAELELRDEEMAQCLRHMLGLPPSGGRWLCRCSAHMSTGHAHACRAVQGPATYARHQTLVLSLARGAEEYSDAVVEKSPAVQTVEELFGRAALAAAQPQPSEQAGVTRARALIPDLSFDCSTANFATDVTVLYGEADSHMATAAALERASRAGGAGVLGALWKRTKKACETRAVAKTTKYLQACAAAHYDFVPFVAESHGFLDASALNVLRTLARAAALTRGANEMELVAYLTRRAAIALQRGNALLERKARRASRGSYGAAVGAGLIARAQSS